MSNQITDLPRFNSYSAARRFYEETAPIRGRHNDVRPLRACRRDADVYRILLDPADNSICLRLHATSVVVWHPDDTLTINLGGWRTKKTAFFIGETSPFRTYHKHGFLTLRQPWPYLSEDLGPDFYFFPSDSESLTFRSNDKGYFVPVDPEAVGVFLTPGRAVLPKYRTEAQFLREWNRARSAFASFAGPEEWAAIRRGFWPTPSHESVWESVQSLMRRFQWRPGDDFPPELIPYEPFSSQEFRLAVRDFPTRASMRCVSVAEARRLVAAGDALDPDGVLVALGATNR